MIRLIYSLTYKHVVVGSIFIIFFLYFGILNRYHILYLEQSQLFLFNLDYLKEHLLLPGGMSLYIGSFFTQFFISSWAGVFILTFSAFTVFILSYYIYKKYNFKNIILAFVPVFLLAILQSNELFTYDQVIGFLFLISFFSFYISISKSVVRYSFYFAGWPILYVLAGGYSIPVVLLCALHELLLSRQKNHYIISVLFIITGVLVPFVAAHFIFYISHNKLFSYPVSFNLRSYYLYALIFLLVWNPLLLLVCYFVNKINSLKNWLLQWNLINVLAGALIFSLMAFVVYKYAYNKRAEIILGIDYHVQHAEWEKVLKLSDRYPGRNRLVIYYTNLALYKTGRLLDKMFSYPQAGTSGLWLDWKRDGITAFFGGEVYDQLAYQNEAYRWAFEAMVARGINPRSLKRLIITSLVNGDFSVAEKFLKVLDQSLFYRKWAQHYITLLSDPSLVEKDTEISRNRELLIHSDFFASFNNLNLEELLLNHPQNKMAYEYLVASLLLSKQLDEFVRLIIRIKDFGYTKMPVHCEEALIFYNNYKNRNYVPEGFSLSPETYRRFQDFAATYANNSNNPEVMEKELQQRHGKTYWFYLHNSLTSYNENEKGN